jgi:phage nucleotide-binding protein
MTTTNPVVLSDEKPKPVDAVLEKLLSRITQPEVVSNNLKVMIYGEPGTGKTTFAGSAGAVGPTLIIDVERGSRTLVGQPNVDVMEYVSIEQVEATIRYLRDDDSAFAKYDTIVFDSLSEMQRRLIDAQLTAASKSVGMPVYKADWDIYNINTQRLRSLMSAFRDIPKNLIVTSQARLDKEEATGIMSWRPDLTPKLAATVAGLFDVVGYLRIDSKGQRVLQVQPSKTVLAKTRTNLPKEIIDPSWVKINK